jgi:hypothetical protein
MVLALVMMVGAADVALALPEYSNESYYYSDSSFTILVGWEAYSCYGRTPLHGKRSHWIVQYQDPCYGGGNIYYEKCYDCRKFPCKIIPCPGSVACYDHECPFQ